jgi:hypothetical protein
LPDIENSLFFFYCLSFIGTNAANKIGIGAFDNDYSDQGLCSFQMLFNGYSNPPAIERRYFMSPLLGKNKKNFFSGPLPGSDQIESDLDVEYATAIAKNVSTSFNNNPPEHWILGQEKIISPLEF